MPRFKGTPHRLDETVPDVSEPCKKKSRKKPCKSVLCKTSEIKIQVQITEDGFPYKFGSISFTVEESVDLNTVVSFTITFKSESSSCCISWMEVNEQNDLLERTVPAVCETPYEILESLCKMKICYFVLNAFNLQQGDNVIQIFFNPSTFISLNSASELCYNNHKSKVYDLLKYFLNVEFKEYEEKYLYDGEQVQEVYASIHNSYDPAFSSITISHDSLIPRLRKYQSQAVHWMLKQEKNIKLEPKTDLHELYTVITTKDNQELYFHKYGGYFVNCKYTPEEPCSGGILADEMGLGKTLEVLACILLNPRQSNELHSELNNNGNQSLQCIKTEHFFDGDMHFECVCGSDDDISRSSLQIACCEICGVCQHPECIYYNRDFSFENGYTCPYCWISNSKIYPSKATLIISPASILNQWEQEISRHVKENHLKVFMYLGVEQQKFIDPEYFADLDIVLVSYETLTKEMYHVNISRGKSGLYFRQRKKFLAIPSPICAIQWWRICLDEAQMVESVARRSAQMVSKLNSVHRWCVTGTPIQKSIEDLHGLFLFLEMKPYQEKVWWKEILWKPFINGNATPLISALKQIAWRTTMQQVLDQIGVPGIEEVLHKLEFSAIERVFYEKQHSFCHKDFMKKIDKFDSLNIKLSTIDKDILSRAMLPLKKLQFICCHFQINQGITDVQKKKMTTIQLLAHLLKTTQTECVDAHRKLLMAMSGAAGIYFIKKDIQNAVDMYEKSLNSAKDNESHFKTDKTQQIHSLYQLSIILSKSEKSGERIQSKFTLPELHAKTEELTTKYVKKYKLIVEDCKKDIHNVSNEISLIMSNFKLKRNEFPTSAWWATVFENVEKEQRQTLLSRLEEVLKNAPGKSVCKNESTLAKCISGISFFGLLSKLFDLSKDLHKTRANLREKIEAISAEPSISTMNSAIACHLRPENKSTKCIYCQTDEFFELYQTKLFRFEEKTERSEVEDDDVICYGSARRGNQGDSDLEIVLKFLLTYSRRIQDIPECAEDGTNEMKLFEALKKEFKDMRNLWLRSTEYVQLKDEVEMAKISTRLLFPGETPPNPPVPYILSPHEIQPKLLQYHSDIITCQYELKKKMGQLFYLKNLEKAENKDAPFEECCPVCQQTFQKSWSVLQCGHCFCLMCIQTLLNAKTKFTNNLGFVCQGIRCPVCRQFTVASEVYFIENDKVKEKEEEILIKGSYSTKTTAIVKCLLEIKKNDPQAKSLVFSNFLDFLHILEHALQENNVKCLNFFRKIHFRNQLEKFKKSEDYNVLLIPLTFGYSGLNITEATNVLLLEPDLDNSKHLQAIGRVHRIGQTKKATIHRFIISKTVEENIYDVVGHPSTTDKNMRSELTLRNLVDVFKDC